ncbi:MAG: hypothetical protein JWP61_2540 [Friedmanniella sp.]|nr:hypothetical protein [Friedmanniella sp.]
MSEADQPTQIRRLAATPAAPTPGGAGTDPPSSTSRLISASAVMAAGTALSRVMGFLRLMMLVFLFGNATRQADMFTIANTVPNSMYILLAGGVLNTVLVPQIVRAIRGDEDGGEAYTNRIMTAGLIVLGVITVGLTLAVPAIINLYSSSGWKSPALAGQYDSMIMLGYYCMPQVFFYGVHVLAGQVLNARERFGPMMWAPIANNVVSIGVLGVFIAVFDRTNPLQPFTPGQELLLGLGSTLGIITQAAVLVPFLRAAGYHFRPRFDFRHTGLGKTFRLAKWTLGYVLVTQMALVVVNKLASGATVRGAGAGLTTYSNAYAVWILPHSLITLSLATAMLPAASRMAAAQDYPGVARETMRALRLAVTALLPAAVAFLALGVPLTRLAFGFGQGARDASFVGWALMALAVGLVPFTIQYVCLRAFYALEDTRSTFFLQVLIAGATVLLSLVSVLSLRDPSLVATALGGSYSGAYLIGVVVSFRRLRRRLPDLDGGDLIRHCVRLLLAVLPAAVAAWLITWSFASRSDSRVWLAVSLVLAGGVALGLFALAARLLRITEVNDIVATLLGRGRRPAAPAPPGPDADAEATEADRGAPGDSDPSTRPGSGTIEETPAAVTASPSPPGSTENAESMAQASIVFHPLDDDDTVLNDRGIVGTDVDASSPEPPRAAALPAGTVLGSRYRIEELLAQSQPSVTWRAFDLVLSRSVLVHLMAPGDPIADDLLAAARKASVATDSRFLRVLDAVYSTDPELGSYIVCEYATGQSLEVILSHGPLSGLESAWVIREVADALSGVHSLGLYHRRINPDTVIITPTGNIKIIGLLIESALRPNRSDIVAGADTPELVDVLDLGRLLYACLVSRWPGGPAYSLPGAPPNGRRWMTPRQVRAGVSPALDNVCDQILGDPPRHRAQPVATANAVVNALTKVLGSADAASDLERRLRQPIPKVGARTEALPYASTTSAPVSALLDQPTEAMHAIRPDTLPPDDEPARPREYATPTPVAPLSTPVRTPVSPAGRTARTPRPTRQPRRWIGILVVLSLLLVTAGVVSAMALNARLSAGPAPSTSAPATGGGDPSAAATPAVVPIVAGRDFDPQGDTKAENPREVPNAYDGNPSTRWRTVSYLGSPRLGNIKRGVGLVLDLGSAQPVQSVRLTLSGTGTTVELRVPVNDPTGLTSPPMGSDADWRVVATQARAGSEATLTPAQPVSTRFVLLYLTSLPKEGSGYRGGIYEVQVLR